MKKIVRPVFLLTTVLLLHACAIEPYNHEDIRSVKVIPDWNLPSPFHPVPAVDTLNPVLTARDIIDVPDAQFVADPFLYFDGNTWHMFFEIFRSGIDRGVIGHATSLDGTRWTYDRIVLTATWHLSYPQIFSVKGNFYMIPEARRSGSVIIYKARNFPYGWEPVATFQLKGLLDPSVVYYHGLWWMFVSDSQFNLYLYYADDPLAGWTEHPMSPIRSGRALSRCGGRSFVWQGDIIRIAQESTETAYGVSVRAFRINHLSKTSYEEYEQKESPLLRGSGAGWNAGGMHHYDPWLADGRWLIAVDGWGEGVFAPWSIGIFTSQ